MVGVGKIANGYGQDQLTLKEPSLQAWQTFGRLRFESNQAMRRNRDVSSPLSMFMAASSSCADA